MGMLRILFVMPWPALWPEQFGPGPSGYRLRLLRAGWLCAMLGIVQSVRGGTPVAADLTTACAVLMFASGMYVVIVTRVIARLDGAEAVEEIKTAAYHHVEAERDRLSREIQVYQGLLQAAHDDLKNARAGLVVASAAEPTPPEPSVVAAAGALSPSEGAAQKLALGFLRLEMDPATVGDQGELDAPPGPP